MIIINMESTRKWEPMILVNIIFVRLCWLIVKSVLSSYFEFTQVEKYSFNSKYGRFFHITT